MDGMSMIATFNYHTFAILVSQGLGIFLSENYLSMSWTYFNIALSMPIGVGLLDFFKKWWKNNMFTHTSKVSCSISSCKLQSVLSKVTFRQVLNHNVKKTIKDKNFGTVKGNPSASKTLMSLKQTVMITLWLNHIFQIPAWNPHNLRSPHSCCCLYSPSAKSPFVVFFNPNIPFGVPWNSVFIFWSYICLFANLCIHYIHRKFIYRKVLI